jgi:hypothetical protein
MGLDGQVRTREAETISPTNIDSGNIWETAKSQPSQI